LGRGTFVGTGGVARVSLTLGRIATPLTPVEKPESDWKAGYLQQTLRDR